jgi:hypothetical protein
MIHFRGEHDTGPASSLPCLLVLVLPDRADYANTATLYSSGPIWRPSWQCSTSPTPTNTNQDQ